MANIFPAGLTWAALQTNIADFLSLGIVVSVVLALLALRFGPKAIRALFSVARHS